MKMKRSFTYLILLALVAGLLAACGEEPTPNPG
jgi:predicted small lipoprotein YifL